MGPKLIAVCEAAKGRATAQVAAKKGSKPPGLVDVRGDRLLTRGPAAVVRVS